MVHRSCCAWYLLPYESVRECDPCGGGSERARYARVIPSHAGDVDVEQIWAGQEGGLLWSGEAWIEVGAQGKHRGINRLGAWLVPIPCGACSMSWDGDNLRLPDHLAPVLEPVRITSPYRCRAYLNYCTFNYTMSWWDRSRWEREIDWMALHGVTMPLATTGHQAVWQATLRHFGMNDDDIRAFFAGPAFSCWQQLTNIEGWGGPLPQSWIDSHLELGRFILTGAPNWG